MRNKIFGCSALILTSLVMTSCGYGLKEVYDGIPYNSPIYGENYYRVWDERLVEGGEKSQLTSVNTYELNKEKDLVFESYKDPVFERVESDASTLDYNKDFPGNSPELVDVGYGPTKRLSRIDNSFRYGVSSKLFDGQMFCHAKYELARTQIDEGGFGMMFSKETPQLDYIAINLKGSVNHKTDIRVPVHLQYVQINVSFFCKNDRGFDKHTFTHKMDVTANDGGGYNFFGFKVDSSIVKRVQGISISYEHLGDNLDSTSKTAEEKEAIRSLEKSLWIYEIFLPNTTWR